jgi:hypothetical protein
MECMWTCQGDIVCKKNVDQFKLNSFSQNEIPHHFNLQESCNVTKKKYN